MKRRTRLNSNLDLFGRQHERERLDEDAPSLEAELIHYMDNDVMAKFLFKNFMVNWLELPATCLEIPVRRLGKRDSPDRLCGDASVLIGKKWLKVELKLASINLTNIEGPRPSLRWTFDKLKKTDGGRDKPACAFFFLIILRRYVIGHKHDARHTAIPDCESFWRSVHYPPLLTPPCHPEWLNQCGFFWFRGTWSHAGHLILASVSGPRCGDTGASLHGAVIAKRAGDFGES